MNLRDTPDGRHCDRHDVALARGEVCQRCVLEPAEPGVELTSTELDDELLIAAAECVTRERVLWRHAKALLEGTAIEQNTAAKLSAESAKWSRIAREIKGEVSQRRQLREAMAHEQAMTGKRGRS